MNSQWLSLISITHMLPAVLLLQCLITASAPQFNISSSSSTPCYGDVVTLVCHHPEVATNPGRYLTSTPTWREDGVRITPSDGTMFEANTSPDSTSTTLTINITVDHFRNKLFYYSCFLVLAGASAVQLETSQNVTIDPIDLTPPPLTSIDSLASTITLKWSDQPCTVRYSVSWMYTNDDGTATTDSGVTELTNYTIPTSVGGVYTVSVEAVDGVGIVGPSTTEVVRSTYPQPTDDGSLPCKDRSLVLRCQESGLHDDRRSQFIWMDSGGPLASSDQYTINGPQLTITNASAVSDNTIRCGEVLTNGLTVTGVEYRVEPLIQPGPPVVTIATTDSSITLTWNTTLHCFESEIFTFVVIWNEIGSGTSNNVTISSSPYTISGLQPVTSYEVSVHGVSGSGVVSEQRVLTVTTGLGPTDVPNASIAVAVIVPVVTILITVISTVIFYLVVFQLRKRGYTYEADVRHSHSQESVGSPDRGETTPIDETGTNYAELTFEGVQPIKPPPLECGVTYTEALAPGERIVMKEEPVPELPQKRQDPKLGKEFRADVANVLTKMGVHTLVCREIKNAPFLTGDYNGIHFVAYCVHTSSDVTAEDVRRIVEAKQVTGAAEGLLIANQDTIPSDCLLDLNKGGCEFVPVSYYGDEGWGNKMAEKFQKFFPIVDQGEELATPVQESTQCAKSYPIGTLRSSSPSEFKSLTELAEDEVHVIDSREETPLLESFDDALNRGEATPDDQSTLPVSASSSVDHLPTQPPADPFRSAPDAENDVDESASQSQSSSNSGFTFTFDPTVNDGHEEEDFVLPQESNQLATPVETSDPAHDSLDPLPSPANTVCVSEEVTRSLPTPVQDTTTPPCGGYILLVMLGHGSIESKSTKKPFVSRQKRSCEAGEYAVLSTLLPPPEHTTSVLQDTLSCGSFWSTLHVKLDLINNNGTIVPDTQCTEESPEEESSFLKTMNNHVLGAFAALLAQEATAQLSLSTTGGVQCYGEWVTLRCTHPVLPQKPRFCQSEVDWRRNRRRISAVGLGRTIATSTTTQLQFIITDLTVGSPVVTMATTDSSTALTWNTTLHCFESEIFDFVVNWNEIHNSPETSDNWSSYGRLVTGWLKKKSELLTEAWQYEHTFPGELARVPSTAVQYVEKNSHHLQLQSIPYHTNVHWATFLLLTVLHLSGARFIE